MLIVTVGGELSASSIILVRDRFETWINKRGLQEVVVQVFGNVEAKGVEITILTVNNLLDEVLNK